MNRSKLSITWRGFTHTVSWTSRLFLNKYNILISKDLDLPKADGFIGTETWKSGGEFVSSVYKLVWKYVLPCLTNICQILKTTLRLLFWQTYLRNVTLDHQKRAQKSCFAEEKERVGGWIEPPDERLVSVHNLISTRRRWEMFRILSSGSTWGADDQTTRAFCIINILWLTWLAASMQLCISFRGKMQFLFTGIKFERMLDVIYGWRTEEKCFKRFPGDFHGINTEVRMESCISQNFTLVTLQTI